MRRLNVTQSLCQWQQQHALHVMPSEREWCGVFSAQVSRRVSMFASARPNVRQCFPMIGHRSNVCTMIGALSLSLATLRKLILISECSALFANATATTAILEQGTENFKTFQPHFTVPLTTLTY